MSSIIWVAKNEEVGQKTKVVDQRNPKTARVGDSRGNRLVEGLGVERIDDKQSKLFHFGFCSFLKASILMTCVKCGVENMVFVLHEVEAMKFGNFKLKTWI